MTTEKINEVTENATEAVQTTIENVELSKEGKYVVWGGVGAITIGVIYLVYNKFFKKDKATQTVQSLKEHVQETTEEIVEKAEDVVEEVKETVKKKGK